MHPRVTIHLKIWITVLWPAYMDYCDMQSSQSSTRQRRSARLDISPHIWPPRYTRDKPLLPLHQVCQFGKVWKKKKIVFSAASAENLLVFLDFDLCQCTPVCQSLSQILPTRGCLLADTVALWLWSSLLKRTGCTRRSAFHLAPSSSTASSSRAVNRGSPVGRACGNLALPARVPLDSPCLKGKKRTRNTI